MVRRPTGGARRRPTPPPEEAIPGRLGNMPIPATAQRSLETLDRVLAMQFVVAWAGEGRSRPKRLGWWDTDLIDEDGGGDLFARLLPQTHAWASLEAVREAARRVDANARSKLADGDGIRSLFFLGFDLDEQLRQRLAFVKQERRLPNEALAFVVPLGTAFSREKLESALRGRNSGNASFAVVPGGRRLEGAKPADPAVLVERLAAALVPFTKDYPLPFYPGEQARRS